MLLKCGNIRSLSVASIIEKNETWGWDSLQSDTEVQGRVGWVVHVQALNNDEQTNEPVKIQRCSKRTSSFYRAA